MSDWYTTGYGDDWKIDSDFDVIIEQTENGTCLVLNKQDLLEMLKVMEETRKNIK